MPKKKFVNKNIICDVCGYQNHREYIQFSGVCHGCGKVLDKRAKFRFEMIKKSPNIMRNDRRAQYYRDNIK